MKYKVGDVVEMAHGFAEGCKAVIQGTNVLCNDGTPRDYRILISGYMSHMPDGSYVCNEEDLRERTNHEV